MIRGKGRNKLYPVCMLYWRDAYFRDLHEASIEAAAEGWSMYAEYCSEQEKGLRSRAFAALKQFIRITLDAPLSERQRFVSWLLAFANERDGRDQLIPYPLKKSLIEPTLLNWLAAEPNNSVPHRWLGDREHLERALELDPSDQIARKNLIILLLSWLNYATHELPRGYLGSVPDDLKTLDRVEALLAGLSDESLRSSYAHEVAEERSAIANYLERDSGSSS